MKIMVTGDYKIDVQFFIEPNHSLKYFLRIGQWMFSFEEIIVILSSLTQDKDEGFLINHANTKKVVKVRWIWTPFISETNKGKAFMLGSQCLREKSLVLLISYILEQDLIHSKKKSIKELMNFCLKAESVKT